MKALAGKTQFEFQRLHGMGEGLYEELAKLEKAIGDPQTPVRIYAPVGSHKELLAYLVRRLLENGANSSFVNRIADEQCQPRRAGSRSGRGPRRARAQAQSEDPAAAAISSAPARRNSAGVDLSDPLVREPLLERLKALEARSWTAKPGIGKGKAQADRLAPRPPDHRSATAFEATRG